MKNIAKLNNLKDNRNFQEGSSGYESPKSKSSKDVNQDLFKVNKGFPHYGKKYDYDVDDFRCNYDYDMKKTEQKGYVDDTDFGIKPRE